MEIRTSTLSGPTFKGPVQVVDGAPDVLAPDALAPDGPTAPPENGDTVNVSHDALLLTAALRAAQNTPDVRAEKVEALRAQVATGAYKPNLERVALAIASEEAGLFSV